MRNALCSSCKCSCSTNGYKQHGILAARCAGVPLLSSRLSGLPLYGHAGLSEADKAELLAKWDRADGECCVCMDAPGADVAVLTRCGHGPMCRDCIVGHLQSQVPDACGSSGPFAQHALFATDRKAMHGHRCAEWLHLRKTAGHSDAALCIDRYAVGEDTAAAGLALAFAHMDFAISAAHAASLDYI